MGQRLSGDEVMSRMTHFACCLRTLWTRLAFPLPGGPVMVMKVDGYSDNHLSTLFSASIRSFQAFFPTDSPSSFVEPPDEVLKKPRVLLNRPSFCLTHLMSEYCSRSHTPSSLDRTKNALMGSKKV